MPIAAPARRGGYPRAVVKPLVFRHGVAATVFEVTLIVWGGGELFALLRTRGGARAGRDPTYFVMTAALVVGVFGAFNLARYVRAADITGGRAWPVVAGLAILVCGVALRAWAIVTLGRFFTYAVAVQEGQNVIESGPYRLVRHPSYTGLLIGLAGAGLALDNWLALAAIVLIPLAAILVRIGSEEATLNRELGEPYRAYSARTRRLVPGVW
jgi:protein-S-isoprenylcysteine O-methyltransferase Ste14